MKTFQKNYRTGGNFCLRRTSTAFYKTLKEIADKYDFAVLAKIRFADLVEVSAEGGQKRNI